jgi:hypothetical protein
MQAIIHKSIVVTPSTFTINVTIKNFMLVLLFCQIFQKHLWIIINKG